MALKDSVLNIVITARDLAKGTIERFRKNLKDTGDQADKTDSKLGGLVRRIGALVAAYASFSGVRSAVTAILSTGDKFEKLGQQMEAVMGSIAEGERATEWVKEFTKSTPLQLEQTTEAFVRLKNFGLDPMDGSLQAIVDQNEKLGGGQERLQGIVNALGQAWAKQKLQAEETLQLVERGVPVYDLLAKATGRNVAELQDMSKNGELGRDVIRDLIAEMGKAAEGNAANAMTRLSGIVSNLKDQFAQFLNQIAEQGVLDYFKRELAALGQTISRMAQDGSLQAWARSISNAIVTGAESFKALVTGLWEARGAIVLFGQAWAGLKLASAVGSVTRLAAAIAGPLVGGTTRATASIRGLGTALRAIGWAGVIQGALDVAQALGVLKQARDDLAGSQNALAKVQADEAAILEQYREQTGLAVESLDQLITLQEEGLAVFDQANERWIAGTEAVKAYRDAQEEAAAATEGAADTIETSLNGAVKAVIDSFETLRTDAGSASEAIEDLLGDYDLGALDDVRALAGGLLELRNQGEITADELETGLGNALRELSSEDLVKFRIAAEAAFGGSAGKAQELALVLNGVVRGALQNLGVDLQQLSTGLTATETKAIDAFAVVVDSIQDTEATAEESSRAIAAAFTGALQEIETEAGKARLLSQLEEAARRGTISTQQFNEALRQLGSATDSDSAKVRQLREEIRRLRQELQQGGDDGLEMGEEIEEGAEKASAGAALLAAGFTAAQASMEALSDGAARAWMEMQTGMRQAAAETDEITARINTLEEGIDYLNRQAFKLTDATGIQGALHDIKISANQVEIAFLEQKQAAQGLQEQYQNNAIAADDYIARARHMIAFGDLLDDQDLSNLRKGIDAARKSMEALRESTEDTLNTLRDELDRLQGNTESIERRRYEQRIQELSEKLEFARQTGDDASIANAQEALRIAKEIRQVEVDRNKSNAEATKRERQAETRTTAQQNTQRDNGFLGPQSGSGQTITLRVGNQAATIETNNPTELLDLLAEAGLRT